MVKLPGNIDVKESVLRRTNGLLDLLLKDHTTGKNILWATDSYQNRGKEFAPKKQIKPELVTRIYSKLIQPRASKSLVEQRQRTKEKAEVFTPKKIIKKINDAIDEGKVINKTNWQEYVSELRLEITCGEGPFIATRYNPTSNTGKLLKIKYRVGFLDKKLKIVSKYCQTKEEWLKWTKEAFKSSYGYEWQGDNLLIARENLLYTFIDNYKGKFKQRPQTSLLEEIAKIISWNIFQMDGLKYVVPMSCLSENKSENLSIFGSIQDLVIKSGCDGCRKNNNKIHNGIYVKIMDWEKNRQIKFIELVKNGPN